MPPPQALAIYTDGVRYQSPLSTNCDTITGFWLINMTTGKRHLITPWRSNMSCRCGCGGRHSMWQILRYIKYCLLALADGKRPATDVNGNAWADDHIMKTVIGKYGTDLGVTGLVGWLKGDWADVNKTHGVPSVMSSNNPCPFCSCKSADMHAHYAEVGVDFLPWDHATSGQYADF